MRGLWSPFISVTLRGDHASQVIDRLLMRNVRLYELKAGQGECVFLLHYAEISLLRKCRYGTGCTVSLKKKASHTTAGSFLAGHTLLLTCLVVFIATIALLNQFIWSMEIEGASPELRDHVEAELTELGIRPGMAKRNLSDEADVAMGLYRKIEPLSWLSFQRSGSHLSVHIKEKKGVSSDSKPVPSDLVAEKTGVIHGLTISSGKALVKVNDFVKKGDTLVTGAVGREGEKPIASDGEVTAETWYEAEVTVPLTLQKESLTGQTEERHSLQVGRFSIPWWTQSSFKEESIRTLSSPLTILGYKLPVGKTTSRHYETKTEQVTLTGAEAKELAMEVGKQEIRSMAGDNAQIQKGKILHEQIVNGKVKLTIYFQTIEDIAVVKPFNEETRE